VVLRQIPSTPEIMGILLVAGGVALHREVGAQPGKQARNKAAASERRIEAKNQKKGTTIP